MGFIKWNWKNVKLNKNNLVWKEINHKIIIMIDLIQIDGQKEIINNKLNWILIVKMRNQDKRN